MSKPIESFASRLRTALDLKNMSQAELCRLTKTPKSSMSQYLSGRNLPKTDRIYNYSQILMVSPTWLLGYDVPMKTTSANERIPDDAESELYEQREELFYKQPYSSADANVNLDIVANIPLNIEAVKEAVYNSAYSEDSLEQYFYLCCRDNGGNYPPKDWFQKLIKGEISFISANTLRSLSECLQVNAESLIMRALSKRYITHDFDNNTDNQKVLLTLQSIEKAIENLNIDALEELSAYVEFMKVKKKNQNKIEDFR